MSTPGVKTTPALKWWRLMLAIGILLVVAVALRPAGDEPAVKSRIVRDPSTIAHLCDEYIQDAIPTIANQPFSGPEHINRDYAIQYAIRVICRKQAYQKLNDGLGRIEPQLVSQYIRQYLNTGITDVDPPKDFTTLPITTLKAEPSISRGWPHWPPTLNMMK